MLALVSTLLAPAVCSGCGRPGPEWCSTCAAIAAQPHWIDLGLPTCVLFAFAGPVRRTIIDWKEEGRRAARRRVVQWLAEGLAPLLQAHPEAMVVPVPSSPGSDRSRGGRVLADALGEAVAMDRIDVGLVAARSRRDQAGLGRAARRANLDGAMRWEGPTDRPLIIVDDIVTSGATLREAARALRAAAASPACAFALARR